MNLRTRLSQEQGMREKRVAVTLPAEVIAGFGWAEDEVSARVREVLVMGLLRRHAVSQRKVAELLKLSLRDLCAVMGQYKVSTIDLTPEELHREVYTDFEQHQESQKPIHTVQFSERTLRPVPQLTHCSCGSCQVQ